MPVPALTPAERSLRARLAAHQSWARTADPAARTANARAAFADRFEREVDPDGALDPADRARRAAHARKAYFARLALKSAQARRAVRGAVTAPHEPRTRQRPPRRSSVENSGELATAMTIPPATDNGTRDAIGAQLRRRRAASYRLPPLDDGRRDPLDPVGGPPRAGRRDVLIVRVRGELALVRGWPAAGVLDRLGLARRWSATGRGYIVHARHLADVVACGEHLRLLVRVLDDEEVDGPRGPATRTWSA